MVALQEAHLQGRIDAFEATYRIRHRDGHYIWILDRGRVLQRAPDGRPLRMVGTHLDVTAAMEAEATLRRSEQSLSVTLQSIGDGVIATDAAGTVTRINDAARRLTGWDGDSAIGRPLREVFDIRHAQTGERKVLVVGGTGHVGRLFLEQGLAMYGDRVEFRMLTRSVDAAKEIPPSVRRMKGDIRDLASLRREHGGHLLPHLVDCLERTNHHLEIFYFSFVVPADDVDTVDLDAV